MASMEHEPVRAVRPLRNIYLVLLFCSSAVQGIIRNL